MLSNNENNVRSGEHDRERRAEALAMLERATELPLLTLSLAIIPLLLVPIFLDLSVRVDRILLTVDWTIWAVFAIELAAKTYLAPRRMRFLIENWFDVVIVAIPFLRPLRVVRSARALRLLRAGRAVAFLSRSIVVGRQIASQHGLQYALLVGGVLIVACAGAVTVAERDAGGNINDFGTALWWASTTVTTVGYGDTYPVTPEGRGVAIFLMLVGITLFSLLTATIAAFFVESRERADVASLDDVMRKLNELEEQIRQMHETNSEA